MKSSSYFVVARNEGSVGREEIIETLAIKLGACEVFAILGMVALLLTGVKIESCWWLVLIPLALVVIPMLVMLAAGVVVAMARAVTFVMRFIVTGVLIATEWVHDYIRG